MGNRIAMTAASNGPFAQSWQGEIASLSQFAEMGSWQFIHGNVSSGDEALTLIFTLWCK